jgi:hypothetical protein
MLNLKAFESKISTPFGSKIKLDTVSNLGVFGFLTKV